jgi:hypothetical protein
MHIPDGLLHYNPQMVSPQQIADAVHSNRLNDVLGLGPYSKDDIFSRLQQGEQPLAVVIRDQGGHEALSSFGTHATADHQIAAMKHQVPDGGSIGVEPVENVLRERVGHFRNGGAAESYKDPESQHIQNWNWLPLHEVQEKLGDLKEIPSHVVNFGEFMDRTADRAEKNGLTPRDLIKAYTITRSSIQRGAVDANKVRATGLELPHHTEDKIRPEGAFGEWMHTPAGQAYLDHAERGQVHEGAVADAVKTMAPFGKHETDIPDALTWAATNLPGREQEASHLISAARAMQSDPDQWRHFTKGVRGIGPSKSGFYASLLGRGDQPTLDARQIILNTGRPTKEATPYLTKKGGSGGIEAVNRLAARQQAMNLSLPEHLHPYYQHLAHHAIWDAAGGDETTHQDVINSLAHAATGGTIHMPSGGDVDEHDLVDHPVGGAMMAMHTPVQKTGEGVMSRDEELARNPVKLGKFSMPLSEVSATTVSKGTLQPWHEFNPEKAVQEKARIFPAVGDRSAAGQMLTHVGDTELTNPVNLTGGADYMRSEYSKGETPSSWASRPIPARKMAERIQKRTPEGSTAYMAHVNMGIPSADSSHMMAQSILRQIPSSKITKANLKKFNETIEEKLPGWPGVENTEEAEKFILRRPGTNISYLSKLMDQSRWKKAGFPNVGQTRFAVAEPRLLSAPQLSVGYALSKAATHGNLNKNPEHKHETYAGQIPSEGGYAGGLKNQVPASVIFPDWWKNLRPNARAPKGATKAQQALMTQFPAQEANQEWLDNLMSHIEEHKKVWGYNDGGTVNKALSVASKATKAKHKTHSR